MKRAALLVLALTATVLVPSRSIAEPPPDFRQRCRPNDRRAKPECAEACEGAGKEGRALDELLPLDCLGAAGEGRYEGGSLARFDGVCLGRWRAALPAESAGRLPRCEPRREVVQYALELRLTHIRKRNGAVADYEAPDSVPGVEPMYKSSPPAHKRRYMEKHLELLEKVLACPLFSDADGVRTVAQALLARAKTKLVDIAKEEAAQRERAAARAATIKRLREELAPELRKAVGCPRCSVDDVWTAHEVGEAACRAIQSKREASAELAKLRGYGRRHGVVDLAELKEQSDAIREADETLAGNTAEFRKVTKQPFRPTLCRAVAEVSAKLDAAAAKLE